MHTIQGPGSAYCDSCHGEQRFLSYHGHQSPTESALHVSQGGMAAVAAPVMGPVSDAVFSSFGDTILVELGLHAGFDVTTKIADDLVIDKSIKHMIPIHSKRLETTGVKVLLVTIPYKHTLEDAELGFYRSSLHQ